MRREIRSLQQRTGLTAVYVTHDQVEAFAISDRIAVMNEGRIEQIGTPREIYARPDSAYVADFLGAANILFGTHVSDMGAPRLMIACLNCAVEIGGQATAVEGSGGLAALRPEDVTVSSARSTGTVEARVKEVEFLGRNLSLTLDASGTELRAFVSSDPVPSVGQSVWITAAPGAVIYLGATTQGQRGDHWIR